MKGHCSCPCGSSLAPQSQRLPQFRREPPHGRRVFHRAEVDQVVAAGADDQVGELVAAHARGDELLDGRQDPRRLEALELVLDPDDLGVLGARDLVRDARGQATMSLQARTQRLEVVLGANYRAVVIYAPKPTPGRDAAARNFVCIEPVAGIINALNLAHKGVYKELQSIPPAGVWQESFWIRPGGF